MERGTMWLANKAATRASGEPVFTAILAAGAIALSHATVLSHYRVTDTKPSRQALPSNPNWTTSVQCLHVSGLA